MASLESTKSKNSSLVSFYRKLFPKSTFNWVVEGFSRLDESKYYTSIPFEYAGHKWALKIFPNKQTDGKVDGKLSLGLAMVDGRSLPNNCVLVVSYNLYLYRQMKNTQGNDKAHILHGYADFQKYVHEYSYRVISNAELKNLNNGYILNDTCKVGVKFRNIKIQKNDGRHYFEHLKVQQRDCAYSVPCTHTFTINDDHQPLAHCWPFIHRDHKWNLKIQTDSKKSGSWINICLELVTASSMAANLQLYIEFSLKLADQANGKKDKILHVERRFDQENNMHIFSNIMLVGDFRNPLNGYLVENKCLLVPTLKIIGTSMIQP